MTDEEYQRLKEAEKEHLQAKKKLQETLQALQRKQGVREAVNRMARSAQGALDRASDLISKLTAETARDEARLDVATDATDDVSSGDADIEAFEAKRRAEHARMLVRQMKQSQALSRSSSSRTTSNAPPSKTVGSKKRSPTATSSDEGLSTSDPDDLPEKTIGRMRSD